MHAACLSAATIWETIYGYTRSVQQQDFSTALMLLAVDGSCGDTPLQLLPPPRATREAQLLPLPHAKREEVR